MKRQDTVLHIEDLHEQRLPRTYMEMWAELDKQAEASYKAGYEKAKQESNAICHLDVYKEGMREVVKWLRENEVRAITDEDGDIWHSFQDSDWQAFLKEKGIELGGQ